MTTKKPILDVSTWTKCRINGVAYVVVLDPDTGNAEYYSIRRLMNYFKVVDYKIRDGVRTNPSGKPEP